ncbi:MAG: nucleotide exchange factor GrpE [Pseudonocardiaceae bacterium]
MSSREGTAGHGANGEEQPRGEDQHRVVVRDKRRIDPVTGKVRTPPTGDQPAGGGVHVDEGDSGAASMQAEELSALQAQVDERTGDLQRISAEYSNYRRRVERDRQQAVVMAKAQLAGELLTVLDDIEQAQQHGDLSGPFKAVADKLVAALHAQGLAPFGEIGDGFDPDVHEAVQHDTSPEVQVPTVTTVLRRGYRFGERVLRPAMVAVTDAAGIDGPQAASSADLLGEGFEPFDDTAPETGQDAGPQQDSDRT